ncbi:MAG: carboxy terminal-processing peptidase [Planctomycetaceae bacterium]|nr:carboxy terminal-processing peptidase [Planctomycetaceae bacterium]
MKQYLSQKITWWFVLIAMLVAAPFLLTHLACNAATNLQGNPVVADELKPTATDGIIGRLVSLRLPREHISKHPLDETISKRAFDLYLKSLDPAKYYFYQSDIDEFKKYETEICKQLTSSKVDIGFEMYNRFLQRFDERTAMTEEILKSPLDLSVHEEYVIDKDLLTYPKTKEEAYDRCRKKVKFDLLKLKADNRAILEKKNGEKETNSSLSRAMEDPIARLQRRYESTKKRVHLTNNDEVLELYLSAVTGAYDPHSSYMSQTSYKEFMERMGLDLEGIGASLTSEDGITTIRQIISGGPADKDGRLKIDDKILGVGQGTDGEIEDVVDWKLNDVVQKIRGKAGTTVRLLILPDDGSGLKTIEIVRRKVELEDSQAQQVVFDVGTKDDGTPYRVGVIDLPSFYLDMKAAERGDRNPKRTVTDVRTLLEKFNEQKVDVVVMNLSKNGGGSLPEAVDLTGLFIELGPVVQLKRTDETRARPLTDPDPSISWTGPLVVITSKFSASASEIFAGAIKDYKRGIVVGDSRTHGKGSVQAVQPLSQQRLFGGLNNPPEYGTLRLTIQQYYLPAGTSPQVNGVEADVVIPSLTDHFKDICESDLDYYLPYDEVPPSNYPDFGYVTSEIIRQLQAGSERRVADNTDFQRVKKDIQIYTEMKDRPSIPLNEEAYNADRAKIDTDKEEQDKLESIVNNSSKIKRDFYLNEVMSIAVDYVQILKEAGITFKPPTQPRSSLNRIFL